MLLGTLSLTSYVLRLLAYVFVFGAGLLVLPSLPASSSSSTPSRDRGVLLLLSALQTSNDPPRVEVGHWVEVDRTVKFGAAPSLT